MKIQSWLSCNEADPYKVEKKNKISNMNIIYAELNQQLVKIIKEKIHLVFSMGTPLEAASHCKPTSLLNFTQKNCEIP